MVTAQTFAQQGATSVTPVLNQVPGVQISFPGSSANGAAPAIQNEAYDRLVVPAPGRIFYEDAFWIGTQVNPKRRTQPLLITAAEKDRTVTPFTASTNTTRIMPSARLCRTVWVV